MLLKLYVFIKNKNGFMERFSGLIKFSFSKKTTRFKTIFDVYLVIVKSSGRLFQNFVAFSECLNFKNLQKLELPLFAP